jgi:hypothetical protein
MVSSQHRRAHDGYCPCLRNVGALPSVLRNHSGLPHSKLRMPHSPACTVRERAINAPQREAVADCRAALHITKGWPCNPRRTDEATARPTVRASMKNDRIKHYSHHRLRTGRYASSNADSQLRREHHRLGLHDEGQHQQAQETFISRFSAAFAPTVEL